MTLTQGKKAEQIEQLNIESIDLGDLTWINITKPTQREMDYLAKNFPFHPLDLDDCLSRKQRPKLDEYKDYLFFIFHFSVYNRATRVSTHDQVAVFISDKYLITVHSGQLKTLVELFRECQIDEEARRENLSNGSGYLLYRLLDRTVDAYFPILDKILSLMDDVEDSVFDENVESAQEVAILRRDIITQRRIMFPVRTVLAELENKLKRFTKTDISVYYGDLMDHMNKICETLDECKEIVEVFKDTDFVLSTDRLNRIMRILTVIATVVLPFLAISSLYGMNVHMPGGITSGSWVPFIVIMVVMAVIAGAMLYFFRHRRWV
ncbi:MAG: magnesium transporter CorA family protein [Dehalococcoidales bacterium]|nr:magnesium transporter CorA family protein [Dehalococcoidales bacterium]